MLPDLYLIGFPRCGTTSLFRWLTDHPEVAGTVPKETFALVDPDSASFDGNRQLGTDPSFARYLPPGSESSRWRCEATAINVFSKLALDTVAGLPGAVAVAIVREPGAQMLSAYRYYKSTWNFVPGDMTFAGFVAASERGDDRLGAHEMVREAFGRLAYTHHLERWRARLDERLVVLCFEEVMADRKGVLQRLAARLGIATDFYDDYEAPRTNESVMLKDNLLKRVAIGAQRRLPPGRLYDAMRRFYLTWNRAASEQLSEEDQAALALVRSAHGREGVMLADRFGLPTRTWCDAGE